jgi:hypothetical protein
MLLHRLLNPASRYLRLALTITLATALFASCKRGAPKSEVKDSGSPRYVPIAAERVETVNNATKQPVYQGASGAIEGTVTITGDAPPDMLPYLDKIPPDCEIGKQIYGKLFREGPGRTVADVLVAATGYKGYLRASSDHVRLDARNCGWAKKTVALTFGQRIEVQSKDARPYIPQLLGGTPGALLVAVPRGEPVPVFPQEPGHYVLIDAMRLYSKADVFVVRYPTFDVTGEDGHYRIEGIPIGPVTVSALLPSTSGTASRQVTVVANETTKLDLAIAFSAASFQPPSRKPAASP